ncbi:hypothetical protein TRAPUB_11892 [Trametes pubescens]|uniref:Uncharacterized protein n=1 Tax=Trametes pubescens TaxID=154538 RepID=A0A1M2VVF7_TRAPU|nr:hypothetical protein TRAPUB_11892 [Trametes pubescens]
MSYFTLAPKPPHTGADSPGSSVFDLPIQTGLAQATPDRHVRALSGESAERLESATRSETSFVEEGDIRSRLVRLIPPANASSPLDSIRNFLAYRLPAHYTEREAREEWRDIVEGRSKLWSGIPADRKEMIRGFLVHFESEILKRAHKNFSFVNGSIGNYFLSAAQAFFRSLPSAIFLFSSITNSQANILPVIVTNHTVTIAAELENGERLVGQCEISHPVRQELRIDVSTESGPSSPVDPLDGTLPRSRNVMFQSEGKHQYEALGAPITRLFYINAYGNEIHPSPNPDYISSLSRHDVLVYSCGSLWTSIMPCLALKGVANGIARSRSLRAKVLLLNSANDRETDGYTAVDYIRTITRTLNDGHYAQTYGGLSKADTTYPISAYITHLVYLKGTMVEVDVPAVTALGVRCVEVDGSADERTQLPQFDAPSVTRAVHEILDSGRSAYSRNGSGDQEASSTGDHGAPVPRPSSSSSSTRGPRTAKHAHPSTSTGTSTRQEDDALPVEAWSAELASEPEPAEARPSSPTSASIHLEEDLAAALASPIPERTPPLDAPAPAMPHPRARMSLELPPADPAAMGLLFEDHKLALEGTSPKPCIVPGNALHLIDDDPAAPRSQTPPSVIIVTEDGEEDEEEELDEEGRRTSSQPPVRPTGPRVRFRSRVRITSGVHRHRHSMNVNGTPTPCSSASDSPSSSISAPLRYQADENGAWGPLGKRLSAYAAGNWQRRAQGPTHTQRVPQDVPVIGPPPGGRVRGGKTARAHHERTPLLRPGRQRSYTEEEEDETQTEEELGPEERAMRTAALRREEEAVFGKWPWRIFNRHVGLRLV